MSAPRAKKNRTALGRIIRAGKSAARRYPRALARALREGPVAMPPARAVPGGFDDAECAAAWLGHATVLLRVGGLNIVTDPVLLGEVGPRVAGRVLGPARQSPAQGFALPRVDIVLVSHAHYDHLDVPSLRTLASEGTRVVTASRTGRFIPRGFGGVEELDWEETLEVGGLRIAALRPEHWGRRRGVGRRRGYNSYVIEGNGRRILFAGDTAYTEAYGGVGPVDLAIFGIGAYDPWVHAHAEPEDVWRMFRSVGGTGGVLMPVHHSTFELGDEPVDEPMSRLLAAAGREGHRVVAREIGSMWRADDRAATPGR